MRTRKSSIGFTLIEVLLYLAIFSFIAGALFIFAWNVSDLGVKDRTARAVVSEARLATGQIDFLIRSAAGLDRGASRFDVAPGRLVLKKSGGDGTLSIEQTGGRVTVTDSASPGLAVPLTGPHSQATALVFADVSSVDRTAENISFSLTLRSPGSETVRAPYGFETALRSGATLRNRGL